MPERIPMARALPTAAIACGWLMMMTVALPAVASAQPAADDWKQVEASQELTDYRTGLREGSFDAAAKSFLTDVALPQLALPANRGSIERVRRRMRELLCGDAASDAKALDAALQTIVGFMTTTARNDRAEPIVRINALLFAGEVKGKDGKPWPGAMAPLATAAADPKLPLPLRIVAAQGLARHVEAVGPDAAPTVGPALVKLLASLPQLNDRSGADWLAARTLAMVAELGAAAPPETAGPAFALLEDASRSTTLRARAAAAVAAAGPKAAGIDWSKAVAACRAVALTALETEQKRGERARELGFIATAAPQPGQPGPGGQPGFGGEPAAASAVPELACRRVAWELMTLAEALAGTDGAGGMAAIRGVDQQAAAALGGTLREAATLIDTHADETAILDALAMLTGGPAPAAREPAAVPDGDAPSADSATEPVVNPFGQ